MAEEFLLRDRLSIPQQAVAKRVEMLWASVEELKLRSFPNATDKELPKEFGQDYIAIRERATKAINDMLFQADFIPDEEYTLRDLRARTLKFLERYDPR
jgi:hypothetical protein